MIIRAAAFAVGVVAGLFVAAALAVNQVPELLDDLVGSTQSNGHGGPRRAKHLAPSASPRS